MAIAKQSTPGDELTHCALHSVTHGRPHVPCRGEELVCGSRGRRGAGLLPWVPAEMMPARSWLHPRWPWAATSARSRLAPVARMGICAHPVMGHGVPKGLWFGLCRGCRAAHVIMGSSVITLGGTCAATHMISRRDTYVCELRGLLLGIGNPGALCCPYPNIIIWGTRTIVR